MHKLTPSQQRLFNRELAKKVKVLLTPQKSYGCIDTATACSLCSKPLTLRSFQPWDYPEQIMWQNHDYARPHQSGDLVYCTKGCAMKARKVGP